MIGGALRRHFDAWRETYPPGTLVAVPDWSADGVELTAAVLADDTELPVSETTDIDWRAGVALVTPTDSESDIPVIEAGLIESVGDGVITLAEGLAAGFADGTKVLPLIRARLTSDFSESAVDEELSTLKVTFFEELDALATCGLSKTAPQFVSLPVFPMMADWSDPNKLAIGQNYRKYAASLNSWVWGTLRAYSRQTINANAVLFDRDEIAALWKFFHDRRGRWQKFWLPALKNELAVSANIGAGDAYITIANYTDYAARYNVGVKNRALFILNGNNWWIRRATGLTLGQNRVSIDAAIGTALNASETMVGCLLLVRFADDELELEFDNAIAAESALSFVELEKEYAAALAAAGTASGTITGALLA
jgi:hypothetical protein